MQASGNSFFNIDYAEVIQPEAVFSKNTGSNVKGASKLRKWLMGSKESTFPGLTGNIVT